MTEHERRVAAYLAEVRAKYTQKQIDALGAKGHAFKNPDGHYSYPVDDQKDLENAIHAVGRGGADHDAIRKYIIGRAKAMGHSDMIPDDWNSDGSLKTSNSATPAGETRDDPTPEDWEVSYGLVGVKAALARVKAAQLADPDHGTDPDDAAVLAAIEKADTAIEAAIVAQSKDSHEDKPEKKSASVPAVPKRAFASLLERPLAGGRIELRADDPSSPDIANFSGYASVTGVGYQVRDWLGEYDETVQPGAFAKTLREQSDIPLLFNHDGYPMASTGSGTSRLSEDGHGLLNEAALDRSDGATNTVCVQLRRGVLSKMSFSFRAIKDDWNDAYDSRSVNELALYDTSIVTTPANPATTAELRSLMSDVIGREGRSLMWSLRSAMAAVERDQLPPDADVILEQAIRALGAADETMCRRGNGLYGRARTFVVAGLIEETRKGAVLSGKNRALLQQAMDALSGAGPHHDAAAGARDAAMDAVGQVLDPSGLDGDQGGGNGAGGRTPLTPVDGAGPRSGVPAAVLRAQRDLDLLKLHRP